MGKSPSATAGGVTWQDRESEKQASSREQNEATAQAWAAVPLEKRQGALGCECGDFQCSRAITLTLAEYEAVREHPTYFAVARNHENPSSERVVCENRLFATVEPITREGTRLARLSDPRQELRERRWPRSVRSATRRRGR